MCGIYKEENKIKIKREVNKKMRRRKRKEKKNIYVILFTHIIFNETTI